MAKIVIIAPAGAEDVDDAVKLLKAAGHEVDTEEPTPKSLLHIVLGLLGPKAYGFGPGYAYVPSASATPPEEELPAPEEPEGDPAADIEDDADIDIAGDDLADEFNFENTVVDGEPITAVRSDTGHSILVVEELNLGPKTTYKLNESSFSFWPNDQQKPVQRVDVGHDKWHTSIEVEVQLGEKAELRVGQDLHKLFERKKPAEDKPKNEAGFYIMGKDGPEAGPYPTEEAAKKDGGKKVKHFARGAIKDF